MRLTTAQLENLVEECVPRFPGDRSRREIRRLAEERARELGAWEGVDDPDSESTDPKSKGSAKIDWRISALAGQGRIISRRPGYWSRPDQGE
jgi:hypothetical protein